MAGNNNSGKKKSRWAAGITPYAEMGYYDADYEPKATDILCAFRLVPQAGVDPIEAAAAVAGESSTATWTVVWTDRLTPYEHYQAKCYRVDPVPGTDQYIAYIAYDIDLFEEGSIANLTSSIIGNVFGFKALKSLRLEDMRIPPHYAKTFQGPAHGIVMEREYLNKFGRPLLGATVKPKLGLSARNYGRVVYEALRGGLDFTKDDENINSQPFMRWRDRFLFCMEAVNRATACDRRDQGTLSERNCRNHGGNVRARGFRQGSRDSDCDDRPHDRLYRDSVDGQVGAPQWSDTAPAPRRSRNLHAAEDARREFPRDRQMDAPGGSGPHSRGHSGRQAGGRSQCDSRLLQHVASNKIDADLSQGLYFEQDWASLPAVMPVASGGIHAGQMHQLLHLLGEDVVLQFGGGTIGHPDGIAQGATANRVATEVMIQARNEGRDFLNEGRKS
jgi:ribulose-bisphosphate carboxylase large chain